MKATYNNNNIPLKAILYAFPGLFLRYSLFIKAITLYSDEGNLMGIFGSSFKILLVCDGNYTCLMKAILEAIPVITS